MWKLFWFRGAVAEYSFFINFISNRHAMTEKLVGKGFEQGLGDICNYFMQR
jgi:hypothetical protein